MTLRSVFSELGSGGRQNQQLKRHLPEALVFRSPTLTVALLNPVSNKITLTGEPQLRLTDPIFLGMSTPREKEGVELRQLRILSADIQSGGQQHTHFLVPPSRIEGLTASLVMPVTRIKPKRRTELFPVALRLERGALEVVVSSPRPPEEHLKEGNFTLMGVLETHAFLTQGIGGLHLYENRAELLRRFQLKDGRIVEIVHDTFDKDLYGPFAIFTGGGKKRSAEVKVIRSGRDQVRPQSERIVIITTEGTITLPLNDLEPPLFNDEPTRRLGRGGPLSAIVQAMLGVD